MAALPSSISALWFGCWVFSRVERRSTPWISPKREAFAAGLATSDMADVPLRSEVLLADSGVGHVAHPAVRAFDGGTGRAVEQTLLAGDALEVVQ